MSGETTASSLLTNIRMGKSVVKYGLDIDQVAKDFEVDATQVRKAIRELNRNIKTVNDMWQLTKKDKDE